MTRSADRLGYDARPARDAFSDRDVAGMVSGLMDALVTRGLDPEAVQAVQSYLRDLCGVGGGPAMDAAPVGRARLKSGF